MKTNKVIKFVAENYTDRISLTDLAKTMQMSASHLSEQFKAATGMNFSRYVTQIRFHEACRLLRRPEARITDIGFDAGFQSLSQFNRVFKKLCGQSPTDYRKAVFKIKASKNGASEPSP